MTDDAFPRAVVDIVVACTSGKRYFDLDAVRTPTDRTDFGGLQKGRPGNGGGERRLRTGEVANMTGSNPAGAPPLDWWDDDAETVTRRLVAAMCPRRVCTTCGEPSRRIVGKARYVKANGDEHGGDEAWRHGRGGDVAGMGSTAPTSLTRQAPTLGWTDCGHDAWRDGNTLHITYPEGSNMTTARFIVGDSLAVLRTLPDASVDLVLTSPPFMALRSYLPADHADKAMEMGSETTPGAFIDALLDVVEECRRVVAPHGSICVELGDTYSGKGGAGGEWSDSPATTKARVKGGSTGGPPRRNTDTGWPMQKSLSMIPELFRISLAYGINPLTMRETPRWRIRNVVRWVRPNPPVGALGDKFRPGTSEMVVACVSGKRYFDLDAVRGPLTDRAEAERAAGGVVTGESYRADPAGKGYGTRKRLPAPGGGAPPLDWWKIPTAPYKGAHYATFPPALCDRPILAMCPLRVCTTCGEPSRRIVERGALEATESARIRQWDRGKNHDNDAASGGMAAGLKAGGFIPNHVRPATTVGWSDCGHDTWRPGVVLDPFAGSGTALLVATGHGRDAIGIDLDERNVELAIARIGLFLTVEDARPAA